MLFSIVKWYFIIMSAYFVIFYFYYTLTASKRDKVFPSLLEVVNYIRESKDNQNDFFGSLIAITAIYGIISAIVLFFALITGKL
nr:MAG TPA: hypothetical protein [Caudoviricetes sp.]